MTHQPYFQYTKGWHSVDLFTIPGVSTQHKNWLNEHVGGMYHVTDWYVLFERLEDANWFRLRWL